MRPKPEKVRDGRENQQETRGDERCLGGRVSIEFSVKGMRLLDNVSIVKRRL